MADPLSIAASVITVIRAAGSIGRTLSKIRSVKDTPNAIHALQNEVSDLRIVLGDVDLLLTEPRVSLLCQATSMARSALRHGT